MPRMRNPKLHFPLFFRLRENYTLYDHFCIDIVVCAVVLKRISEP